MKLDFYLLATEEFVVEEIIEEVMPEKYWFNNKQEELFAGNTVNDEETIHKIISFIFNFFFESNIPVPEIYRDIYHCVLDLSSLKDRLIDFDYLEAFYLKWIDETGRINTMDEYGMFLDLIGCARRGIGLKNLLMIMSVRRE